MAITIAFLDANILYPADLRSFLMYLAVFEALQARWSDEVMKNGFQIFSSTVPTSQERNLRRYGVLYTNLASHWSGFLLFAGLAAILVQSALRSSRRPAK